MEQQELTQGEIDKALREFFGRDENDKIDVCNIPERMKELLRYPIRNAHMKHVNKFIWNSLTLDEQFTCLMTFPDEIEQLIGKEE